MFDIKQGSQPCAMAFAVALALGLSGCGGGGGANVRPSPAPTPVPTPTPTGGDFAGGDINVGSGEITVWPNNIGGSIDLIKGGAGTLVLTGTDSYTSGTTINDGTLQLGNGGQTGSIVGNVTDNAALVFNRSDNLDFNGIVSGSGSLTQAGHGTLTLLGTNTYTGGTTISNGTLQLGNGGTGGSVVGDIANNGTLVWNRADDIGFTGTVTGSGGMTKAGNGVLTVTGANSYSGATQVETGSLYVDGDQSAATGTTTVANAATLGGRGTLGGDVIVTSGATLAPGSKGAIGTLTVNGNLRLAAGSTFDYTIGHVGAIGGHNDLVNVNGDLSLDGTLDLSVAPGGGSFEPGVYRMFNYSGTLADRGLALGNVPSSFGALVQTGVAHQVNLVYTQGLTFSFWDGDAGPKGNNTINGGNGTWKSGNPSTATNWTDAGGAVNTSFRDRSFAVFQAKPGTVTVDDSNGDINVSGMQFASDGYVVQGDAIHLVGSVNDPTHSIIRVGDGTTEDAGYKATIHSALIGGSTLVKTGAGTLVLDGANTYTGSTTISEGILQIGSGGNTGAIRGNVTNSGILAFDYGSQAGVVQGYGGVISGNGRVIKSGGGALQLVGDNTYTGGTTISAGTLQIGDGSNVGSIVGDVTNNGTLAFDRQDDVAFNGVISGNGTLIKVGFGTLTLTGNNTYTGATTINNGTVQIGNGGKTGSIKGDVILDAYNGTLIFNRSDDWTYAGIISGSIGPAGSGVVKLGGGTLSLSGASTFGQFSVNAGTLELVSGGALPAAISVGGDNQPALLKIDKGATVSGRVSLNEGAALDNAGVITGSAAVQGFAPNGSLTVVNHDGGLIEGDYSPGVDIPAVNLGLNSTLINGPGSTIRGYTGVSTRGTVKNSGGSIIGVTNDGIDDAAVVDNDGGGHILAGTDGSLRSMVSIGVKTSVTNAVVNNTARGTIQGVHGGVWLFDGGTVTNDGRSSISGGTGVFIASMSSATGVVENKGGSSITGTQAGIVLPYGGTVINGAGSTIATTATAAGDCSATLACSIFVPIYNAVGNYGSAGTLKLTNAGSIIGNVQMDPGAVNNVTLTAGGSIHGDLAIGANAQSTLTLDGDNQSQLYANGVTGSTTFAGTLIKKGTGTWSIDNNNLSAVAQTQINGGRLMATNMLAGMVDVGASGTLDGAPGVAGNLSNVGKVAVHGGDSAVGGNYTQASTGTLAVSLGSKLNVAGTAALGGGTLEVTGADSGYVSNTRTNVLTAAGGVNGTFARLVKDTGVVFTASTIHYDANNAWLDTTGLNVTTAAAGHSVSYTAASLGSAQRVQGAFEQLNGSIAADNLAGVSSDFVRSAGEFQQSPTLQAAQASLQSLSGQLHAATAAMTFESIDASGRVLSDRFDNLLDKDASFGMWMHDVSLGGNMARAGFDGVGFQLNGWLVGNDRQIGRSGVAGFAFGQSRGQQRLNQSFDHDNNRSTEGMLYAGWLNGNWYTRGRVGFGHLQQDVSRQVLLGTSMQGLSTRYNGRYDVAHAESGLHFGRGANRITPYIDVQYASIDRDGFAEQGAGGFGLRSNAQTLDRWQAGLGVRAAHHWNLSGGRAVDFNARAQWQRTLAAHGDVFDASFVGLQQWEPLAGIGLSRYSGLFGVGMDATLTAHTMLNFSYDYETGQRNNAQMLSARLNVAF